MGGLRHKQGVCKGLEKNIQGQNRKGWALIFGALRHNKSTVTMTGQSTQNFTTIKLCDTLTITLSNVF